MPIKSNIQQGCEVMMGFAARSGFGDIVTEEALFRGFNNLWFYV